MWATGVDTADIARVYHYSSGTWTSQRSADYYLGRGILMLSATDGWITTYRTLQHWDGTTWTSVEGVDDPLVALDGVSGQIWGVGPNDRVWSKTGVGAWAREHGGPTLETLYGVSPVSPTEAWAVGDEGTFAHYISGTWQL